MVSTRSHADFKNPAASCRFEIGEDRNVWLDVVPVPLDAGEVGAATRLIAISGSAWLLLPMLAHRVFQKVVRGLASCGFDLCVVQGNVWVHSS